MRGGIIKSRAEVEAFLLQFLPKMDIFGIIFIEREKNQKAMECLGISFHIAEHSLKYVFKGKKEEGK